MFDKSFTILISFKSRLSIASYPPPLISISMIILFFIQSFHDHSRFDQSWVMTTLNLIIHDHFPIDHSMISSRLIMIKSCVHIHWIPIQFEALMNIEDQISPLSLRLNLEMWSTSCNMSIVQVTITTRFYSSWAFKNICHRKISLMSMFEALFTWPPVAFV